MNVRLYFDEDAMDGDLVVALRARGVDLETALEANMLEREDVEHLAYATARARAIYSFNIGHFCALHGEFLASGETHAGIIVCRQQRYGVGEQMRWLLRLIATKTGQEMHNQLEFLSQWG